MPELSFDNLTALSAQILLAGLAGLLLPLALRLRQPRSLLIYYQLLLLLCLALPWAAPWIQPPGVLIDDQALLAVTATGENLIQQPAGVSLSGIVWTALLLGMAARLAWLAAGLWRLRRYRFSCPESVSLPATISQASALAGVQADARICPDLEGPVTFGLFRPLVLLPESFRSLKDREQLVVACHEFVHVSRHDWLFHMLEELATVVFWFHPMVWWMVARIRLAREQVVDRQVVSVTGARDQYVSALLSVAGAGRPDLAPAPLFLRRTHLKRRIHTLLKEVPVSLQRLIFSYVAIALLLASAVWLAVDSFPLMAAQQAPDADGVTVDAGGPLLHRVGVDYPEAALEQAIGGTVLVDVDPSSDGSVVDARIVSGPAELRRPVLESVLDWHYDSDAGLPATIRVTVQFRPSQMPAQESAKLNSDTRALGPLDAVDVSKLPPPLQERMRQALAPFIGQTLNQSLMDQIKAAAARVDSHVTVATILSGKSPVPEERAVALFLDPERGVDLANIFPESNEKRIRVAGKVQGSRTVSKPRPSYPAEARRQRIQGKVRLAALIGTDGHIKDLRLIDGPPALVDSSVEAVKQWVYRPTLLDGRPVEVVTQVDVNYTLTK